MRYNKSIRSFTRHRPAVIGAIVLVAVSAMAVSAPLFFPDGPWALVGQPLLWPGDDPQFPLGTDMLGRDILAGLLYGARVSLLVGISATLAATVIGTIIGATAGYFGGIVDRLLMGLTEVFQTTPPFVLAVVIAAIFKPSLPSIVFAISFVCWPSLARLVRAEIIHLMPRDFVQAGVSMGISNFGMITRHLLPNAMTPIIVSSSLMTATAILLEAGLSFLGLGDPNVMSWGYIVGSGRDVLRTDWYVTAIPGFAIMLSVLAINMVGEGLNDAMNPRSANH